MKFLSKFFGTLFVWMFFITCLGATPEADFYVSPQGSDHWSGSLAEPNATNTDGPFLTLTRARDAVRQYKANRGSDVLVLIRDGIYPLNETLVFEVADSGVGEFMVTYAAYPNEKPGAGNLKQEHLLTTLI